MKTCPTCKTTKSDDAFAANRRSVDGRQTYCRDCHNARQRAKYAANRANGGGLHKAVCPQCGGPMTAQSRSCRKCCRPVRKSGPQHANWTGGCAYTRYGIDAEIFRKMWEEQDGRCAICQKAETATHNITKKAKALAVDHDHESGKVRGLLCYRCNSGIGLFLDDPSLLQRAASYLSRNISHDSEAAEKAG